MFVIRCHLTGFYVAINLFLWMINEFLLCFCCLPSNLNISKILFVTSFFQYCRILVFKTYFLLLSVVGHLLGQFRVQITQHIFCRAVELTIWPCLNLNEDSTRFLLLYVPSNLYLINIWSSLHEATFIYMVLSIECLKGLWRPSFEFQKKNWFLVLFIVWRWSVERNIIILVYWIKIFWSIFIKIPNGVMENSLYPSALQDIYL